MSWHDNFQWNENPIYGKPYGGLVNQGAIIDLNMGYYQPKEGLKFEAYKTALGLTQEEIDHITSQQPKNKIASAPYNVIRGTK
jgi:hypothetical protein